MAKAKEIDKCKQCGGELYFNVKTSSMECANCGASYKMDITRAEEEDYKDQVFSNKIYKPSEETHAIKCNACGAVDILNNGNLADICPFCGSSNIEDSADEYGFAPNGIVPFQIKREDAYKIINEKVRKSVWAPKDFKSHFRATSVKGIYTPCFTFDTTVTGNFTARIGKYYDKTVYVNGSNSTIREIRWFNAGSTIYEKFDDLVVEAGQMINGAILQDLQPYDTNNALGYDKRMLNGFQANKHDKSLEIAFNQAKVIMENKITERIKEKYNADLIDNVKIDANYEDVKFKYILLPVYTSSFKYKNKTYNIFVNGVDGRTTGKLPVSKAKVWTTVGSILGVLGIIALIVWLIV